MDVTHRACVFTVPEEFRSYFYWHRECLKELQDMAYEVINELMLKIELLSIKRTKVKSVKYFG